MTTNDKYHRVSIELTSAAQFEELVVLLNSNFGKGHKIWTMNKPVVSILKNRDGIATRYGVNCYKPVSRTLKISKDVATNSVVDEFVTMLNLKGIKANTNVRVRN